MDPTLWTWPVGLLPRPVLATRAAFAEQRHRTIYSHGGRNALHVYDYPAEFTWAGRRYDLLPGSVALSPPGVPTTYHLPRPGHHWCVHFLPGSGPGPCLALPPVMHLGAAAAYVRERMARISTYLVRERRPPSDAAAGAVLLEILCWLASECSASGSRSEGERSYRAVERAAALIRERPEQPMDAAELARAVGLSPNWLSRQFRRRFGVSIPRYRLEQRIAQARVLLTATALPIGEIGRRIGFPDPHHFNKLFRRVVGQAPSGCR